MTAAPKWALEGVDQSWIYVPAGSGDPTFDFGGRHPFSYEVWINPNQGLNSVNQGILGSFGMENSGSFDIGAGLYFRSPDDSIIFDRRGYAGATVISASQDPGEWAHVVATYDGTTMRLYVNGEEKAEADSSADVAQPNAAVGIGAMDFDYGVTDYRGFFYGRIDEPAVYDRALSADEIRAHYEAATPAAQPTLTLEPSATASQTGKSIDFTVTVNGVPDATGSELSAAITGANPQNVSATVVDTTATFSYKGKEPGVDSVSVSGVVDGEKVMSNQVTIHWMAGADSTEGSYGVPGTSPYTNSAQQIWADPVNSHTGNFYQSVTDVSIPGTGIPFSLSRTYNSLDTTVGVLGRGWSGNLFSSLAIDDAGNVTLKAGNGQEIGYTLEPDGSYQGDKNVTATLTKTGSGYDLVQKDEDVQRFDSNGHIVSWLDPNGQGPHFAYDSNGHLTSVTDSAGREYDLSYDSEGHLTGVSLPDGTSLVYGYNGDLLMSFTDRTGAITKYAYDANGFLESATDASGRLLFQNTYDDQGRVLTQADASGNTSSFDWPEGKAVATDANGKDWQDTYNGSGQLSTRRDGIGNESGYVYNDANDLTALTDPLGNTTKMTYDERGNMLSQTNVLGGTEKWTYDENNNLTSETDALGNTTTYTYDSNGNITSETDALENVTTYQYDSSGRQIAETDPLGRTTRSVYDDQGNPIAKISPAGAKTTYTYDALGNELSETDPLGNTTTYKYDAADRLVKTVDPLGHVTTSTRDDAGRLVANTDANGNVTRYVYDSDGRQTGTIYLDGSSTHTGYDALGNVISTTDALGKVTKFEYDADGRQIATISPTGERTETKYDADGNAVTSTDALDKNSTSTYDALGREIESTDALGRTTKTAYDADGNVVKKIDALGNVTKSVYDADGNVIETIDPLGHRTKSTYNAAGQLLSETDANGNLTLHAYDADSHEVSTTDPSGAVSTSAYNAAGNLISSTDPLGHTTTYSYDADGNQISKTNALGEKTAYSYDADGNQIAETDPLGNTSKTVYNSMNQAVKQLDPLGNATKTAYDPNGNVISTTDPLGATTRHEYDSEGRLVKETNSLGDTTISTYDKDGQLISNTDANRHTTAYAYNADGEKTQVTAPGGSVTSYDYDLDGNLVKRTDANGHATTYAYDAAGNKVSKTNTLNRIWHYAYDGNGNLIETDVPSGGTITESYDAQDRLTKKSYSDGSPAVSYSYDKAGNKTQMVDGTGKTTYAYDAAGELVGALTPSDSFLYSYDPGGNLLSLTYPNGLKTSYTYNQASEMTTAKVGNGKTYYTYDPNGKLVSTLNANGILENRSYDAEGRQTEISGQDPKGRPLYSRSYTYDQVGNPLTLVATAPRDHSPGGWGMLWHYRGAELTKWTETYTYDSRGRLVKACMNDSCSRYLAYSYDPVGNRVKLETSRGATTYSYDQADELLSTSKHCRRDVTTYAYDRNGNEAKAGPTVYSYNLANELIEAKDGPKQISYTYTGDGLMATRSTREETTSYAWDTNSDLPELAVETDSKGQGRFQPKDSRSYTYGEAPLGIVHGRDALTFHTDAIGSVVELSDDHGQIVDSYRYTPFGESYGPGAPDDAFGDSSGNPIRFTGQYLDSDSGLYDMRAREYDPEIGRFLEEDPLACDESCSSTYIYAENDPTLLVDPTGEGAMMADDSFLGADALDSSLFFSSSSSLSPDAPWNRKRPPKTVHVTFYSSGGFTTPFKINPRALWSAERISGSNGWRICGYGSGCKKHKVNGVSVEYTGPAWAYDEAASNHSASVEKSSIRYAAKYAKGDNSVKGYVFVGPTPANTWSYKKPSGVHITRNYIEMYDSGQANP
jgi:RHS repeat-associated protein